MECIKMVLEDMKKSEYTNKEGNIWFQVYTLKILCQWKRMWEKNGLHII